MVDLICLLKSSLYYLKFIMFSCYNLYFRWHGIKEKEIYDPMEKILVKKAFLIESYEFLKFIYFVGFYYDFPEFLNAEKCKKGFMW